MSSYYCLVTSDTETKFARDIINSRLKEKKYPLYKKTPFLNEIKKNDEVVFYLAGKGENSQSFVATAKILSIETMLYPSKSPLEIKLSDNKSNSL